MAQVTGEMVPTLKEVLTAAEKRLAEIKKDSDERRKWLANNVPDLDSKLATPATRALFAKKLCAAIEEQSLEALVEVTPISAEQLEQHLREQLEQMQELIQIKKAEIEATKIEAEKTEEEVILLARLRKLRRTEGEMRHDERLAEKLAAANRQFKSHRKWLVSMIEDIFADNEEMSNLLQALTSAYFTEGDPYIDVLMENDRISSSLETLIASGCVMRHPNDSTRVRLQDLS